MFKGRNALVTGASSGMGAEIAVTLAKQGVNLALLARSEDKLKDVADKCSKHGIKVHIVPTDMSDSTSIDKAAIQVGSLFDNRVHYLINCAGKSMSDE
jgi:3-oxoacyl-[acyl-carrier protein] reductase